MNSAYWHQWHYSEIVSMQEVEEEEEEESETDLDHIYFDSNLYQDKCGCLYGCNSCLSLEM